jgi:hypothetical protein
MARLQLREVCGYRAGDKGDVSDVAIFADDDETYALIVREVTAVRVKEHFGAMVHGTVVRCEAHSVAVVPDRCGATTSARPSAVRWSDSRSTSPTSSRAVCGRVPTSSGHE